MTAKPQVSSLYLAVAALSMSFFGGQFARAETLNDATISEFLADNDDGFEDEDGDNEDWIEIWNTSGEAGDLGGWYLTDDPNNLTKWQLPAIEMTSGGYLVVFASGKDRTNPASELHTNFGLQRETGGYLALVKPDGTTIASEFDNYPEQSKDIAYGVGIDGETPVTFFSAGASAKWHVPTGPVNDWTSKDFNDSAWNNGATGIGFDSPGGRYLPLIGAGGDAGAEMRSNNASVYIRIPFEVADPTGISNLNLRLKWEDGFVAHLNGTEFRKESAPTTPVWNSQSTDGGRNEDNATTFFNYPVEQGGLVTGTNILAIQGLNSAAGSSDLIFVPELTGVFKDTTNLTTGFFTSPSPGAINSIRYDGLVGDTSFSTDRGVYDTAFDLEISTETEGAEIRYTLDGTPPSETSGQVYTGPISITGTTVVRALAYKAGFQSTNIDTHSYIFPEDVYGAQFSESLTAVPTISLVTQANYNLRLMSVASTNDLPSQSNEQPDSSQVVVALVNGALHVRIIDVHIRRSQETNRFEYQTVINKTEGQLADGQEKIDLQNLLNQAPFPDASTMSPEEQREIIDKAIAISEHTPRTPFLQDSNNDYIEHKSSIEMIYPDGTPGFQEDAGMTNFGGGFTNFAKKSFRLYFRKEYGAAKLKHPVFDGFEYKDIPPVEEFDAINLRSGSHDMSARGAYMGPRFADDSMLDMGQIAPHGRFVHVYLNGQYWGQYHLRERWNADMASSYFGGKKDDYDAISANNSGMEFQNGSAYDGTNDFWNETRTLLTGPNPFANAAEHIDIANVIDFMLLWTSGECESEFRAFGSRSKGVPFKFMLRDPDGFMPNGGWNHDHAVTHNGPLRAMTELRTGGNIDYNILLADRIHKHFFNGGALTAEASAERLRKRYEEMRLGFAAEARRWNFQSVASWESYVNRWLNTSLPQRSTSMMQRLRQAGMYPDILAPALSQHGGSIPAGGGVTMTTNTTAIYYTIDGSDPRLPGGAVSPTALTAQFSNDVREPEDFVVSGDSWKYLDDGSNQGTAWRDPGYDDNSWEAGPSQLGYGETSVLTTVGFIDTDPTTGGNQKNATTYFRKKVMIDDPADFSNFLIGLRYDDGAAVYVNGIEVARTATLPADAAFDAFATGRTPDENIYFEYPVSSARFVNGENTIAVEIHNQSAGSSDIRFDLTLRGEIDITNGSNITQPVMIDGATDFRARSFDSSANEWSALTSTFFSLDTVPAAATNLVISEIHYRPADPTSAEELAISGDRDDFEFIELLNISTQPIDLSGLYFDEGISFFFAENTILEPGNRLVLVKDLEAFTARYGNLSEGVIAGEFGGRLSNDGEQLIIRKSGAIELINLTYNDQLPWPAEADGNGYSMIFTGNVQAQGTSWSAHASIGGAPGMADIALSTGYEDWKTANGITDDLSDSDSDGLSAFAEYATGNNPNVANGSPVITQGLVSVGQDDFLSITYQQGLNVTDVLFEVQESSDLENWTTIPAPILVEEEIDEVNQTKKVTRRLSSPVTQDTMKFLRVRMVR
ncbi:MAG: lamin tail domain-containing protein [Akkermansiaceae bacterium]